MALKLRCSITIRVPRTQKSSFLNNETSHVTSGPPQEQAGTVLASNKRVLQSESYTGSNETLLAS